MWIISVRANSLMSRRAVVGSATASTVERVIAHLSDESRIAILGMKIVRDFVDGRINVDRGAYDFDAQSGFGVAIGYVHEVLPGTCSTCGEPYDSRTHREECENE